MSRRKKQPPVVSGFENGQSIVVRAAGKYVHEMPAFRLYGLWRTIRDMGKCVDAFQAAKGMPDKSWDLMMSMTATVACELMQQAVDDIRAVLALSPTLRAVVARIDANKSLGAPYARLGHESPLSAIQAEVDARSARVLPLP